MRANTLTNEPVDAAGWEETAGVLTTLEEQETAGGYGALLSGITGAAGSAIGGEYGGIVQGAGRVLGGLIDGQQRGANAGSSIGALAGQVVGTAVGGPAGAALGGAAGSMLGGLVGGAVEKATKKPPNKNARAQARAKAKARTDARLAQLAAAQAKPEAPKPTAKPPAERPPAPVASKRDTPPEQPTQPARPYIRIPAPVASAAPTMPPEYPPGVADFRATLTEEQRGRLDQAIRDKRGVKALQDLMAERSAFESMEAEVARHERERAERAARAEQARRDEQAEAERRAREDRERERDEEELNETAAIEPAAIETPPGRATPAEATPPRVPTEATPPRGPAEATRPSDTGSSGAYDDTAAPPAARPRPRIHIGLLPLKQHQLEAVLVKVPVLRRLDSRLLRSMTGKGSSVRDTAGVDPATRIYCAEPGETALGIAKKLTGREERAPELLAANPGRREDDPRWRIPPGWMHFATSDTGAPSDAEETSGTSRLYIIQAGDTPVGIATKSGAKATRPNWWAELKAANPQIPTKDDGSNFERFFAGQQLWIPEQWPPSPMFPQGPGAPNNQPNLGGMPQSPGMPQIPGVPQFPGMPQAPGLPQYPAPKPNGPNTTIDPGVPLQAQALLAYWASANPGAANPADFGTTLSDLTGTTTTRFVSALASFQAWHNARNPAAPVRNDGVLDGATYQALYSDTVGGLAAPGPGAVPWPKPNPQQPQNAPQQPQGGIPGIGGGLPQLGGAGTLPALGSVLIQVLRNSQPGAPPPPSTGAPFPPGAVPGFHVAGQPPNVVWDFDGTMITLPPGLQPLDAIYGTPPADFVWQGGNAIPGPANLPWVGKAHPVPELPPGLPNGSLPWPWGPAPGQPMQPAQLPPAQPTQQPPATNDPKKDSGAALPIVGLLTALAMSS